MAMINTPQDDLLNEQNKEPIIPMSEDKTQENEVTLQNFANEKEIVKNKQEKTTSELWKHLNWSPITNIDDFYTWETKLHDGKEYHILDTANLVNSFGEKESATYWKKTMPTLIRKSIAGERIQIFTKNAVGEYVPESEIVAKEWQYVFQNVNDSKDTFIPQDANIINEYDVGNDVVWNEFRPFIRKSKPSRLLVWIIKKPTMIIVKSRGNAEQYLDAWATLKLEENGDKKEVTGINAWWFEAWSITDKEWNVQKKNRADLCSSLDIPEIAQLFEKPNMTEKDKECMKNAVDIVLSTWEYVKDKITRLKDKVRYGVKNWIEYIQIWSVVKRTKDDIKATSDGKNIFQHWDTTYFKDTFDFTNGQFYGTVEKQSKIVSEKGLYVPSTANYDTSLFELWYMWKDDINKDVLKALLGFWETGRCDNEGNLIKDGTNPRRVYNFDSVGGASRWNEIADERFVGDKHTIYYNRRFGAYPIRAILKWY